MEISGKMLATLATILGMIVGSSGMWFTLKDRLEKQVEDRVTKEITTQTQMARLQERVKSIESDIWTIQQKYDNLQQKVMEAHK